MRLELPKTMQARVITWAPTGSRVICRPPPLDTDEDWVLLVSDVAAFGMEALLEGWSGSPVALDAAKYPHGFASYRKGELNLIVTAGEDFFQRFIAATSVAQRLNLHSKEDRVALFQAVLYGNTCS